MSRTARLGAVSTVAFGLVFTGAVPALADDTAADVTPPIITSTGLTAGQLVGRTAVFKPTVTDDVAVDKVTATVNGVSTVASCQVRTQQAVLCRAAFYQLTSANDLDADVTLTAYDRAGNASLPMMTRVHIDAAAPHGVVSPAPGTGMHSGPKTLTMSGLSDDVVRVDLTEGTPGGAVLASTAAAPWTLSWNATEAGQAPWILIYDRAGNVAWIYTNYVVADEPPVITQVTSYAGQTHTVLDGGAGWAGQNTYLTGTVTSKAPIDHYQWWIDGVLLDQGAGAQVTGYWHDTTARKTSATVELRVWDTVGNEATKTYRVNVDNTAPSLTLTPKQGTVVRGTRFTVGAHAYDPHGIASLNLTGADQQKSTVTTSASLTCGRDGTRGFTWEVSDDLGNTATVRSSVVVDNTGPSIAFDKAPADSSRAHHPFTITAKAADPDGVARVQVMINGTVVATDSTPGYSFRIDPRHYSKIYKIQLRAYDHVGNVRYSSARYLHNW